MCDYWCGRGIGQQIATDFARSGAKVYVCDINQESLSGVRQATTKDGLNITLAVCDVSDEPSVMGGLNPSSEPRTVWMC